MTTTRIIAKGVFDEFDIFVAEVGFPEDKHAQYFRQFVMRKDVDRCIKKLRKQRGLNTSEINRHIAEQRNLQKEHRKIHNIVFEFKDGKPRTASREPNTMLAQKYGYYASLKKRNENMRELEAYINSKVRKSDIRNILKVFNQPLSWQGSLVWYVITGKTRAPLLGERCSVKADYTKGKIIIELTAEATDDDLEKMYRHASALQKSLPGYYIKKAQYKKNLDNNSIAAKEYGKYRKTRFSNKIEKEEALLDLTIRHGKEGLIDGTIDDEDRERARQRKNFQRNKLSK